LTFEQLQPRRSQACIAKLENGRPGDSALCCQYRSGFADRSSKLISAPAAKTSEKKDAANGRVLAFLPDGIVTPIGGQYKSMAAIVCGQYSVHDDTCAAVSATYLRVRHLEICLSGFCVRWIEPLRRYVSPFSLDRGWIRCSHPKNGIELYF
jgi:hypothetical protein